MGKLRNRRREGRGKWLIYKINEKSYLNKKQKYVHLLYLIFCQ